MNIYWVAFIAYFGVLFIIGWVVRRKHATSADMFVGGRKLNFWVTALSAQASDMSSWLFMAFPVGMYLRGMPQVWTAVALVAGMWANWQFVATRLRVQTEACGAYTLPTFLSKRFSDSKQRLRVLAAVLLCVYVTYYLAAGLIAMGFLFEELFGVGYGVGVLVATTAVVGYTLVGGFVSVAWTDLFQAIFLLVAIMLVPLLAWGQVGGFEGIVNAAHAAGVPLTLVADNSWGSWKAILSLIFGWGLGYVGMPHIITKFMGIKRADELVKAKYLGLTWQILALAAAAAVGFVAIAWFRGGLANPELLFVRMVHELFHPVAAACVLCGVIAATISTMDSQIVVAASVATEDLYKGLMEQRAGSAREVHIFRVSIVVIALIALWISLSKSTTIMDAVYYAWAGLGSSFGPVVLCALYSKRVTERGAFWGMLVGGVVAGIWPMLDDYVLQWGIHSMVIAFPASLLTMWSCRRPRHA